MANQLPDDIRIATIRPHPVLGTRRVQEVWVKLRSGKEEKLFEYWGDEISFRPPEFIGLTIDRAHALKKKKELTHATAKAAASKDLLRGKVHRQSDVRVLARMLGRRPE